MKHLTHRLLLAAILATTALTPLPALAAAPAPTASAIQAVAFPQDHSDLTPDPAARFGRLPNGMTYVIYKNTTPAGTVAVHLRIAAGAMMEGDNERGLAHFIEHMAFNGSRNIPRDQLIPLLQRHGIKIGPDAGAYTTPNKTEYVLDLPSNTPDQIDTALFITREFAGNLLFAPDAVERERPVILGEERLRMTPPVQAQVAWLKAAFPGQAFATRGAPIGSTDIISAATPATLQALYHALYRPELATLVIIGDVDPDQIEAHIKKTFSDWKAVGPARAVAFGAYTAKGVKTFTYTAQSLPDTLSATWFSPFDPAPQSRNTADQAITDLLLITALNQRLQHQAQQPDTAFIGASVAQQPVWQTAKILQLGLVAKPGRNKEALAQAVATVHQFTTQGVTTDEIAPTLANLDAYFKSQAAGAATRDNEAIVTNLISNLDANSVFTSPDQDAAEFARFRQALTPDQLNARLKLLLSGDGPLLAHMGESLGDLDAPALEAVYRSAMAAQTTAYAAATTQAWPYTDFGAPQAPAAHVDFPKFGLTRYTFANGVKVTILPTQLKQDQILVNVSFKGGLKALSPATPSSVAITNVYASSGGILAGGLGKLDQEQLQRSLAGKTLGLTYAVGDDDAGMSGTTNRADLATQLQLMMAFTTDAAYNPVFFSHIHDALPVIFTQLSGAPQSVLQLNLAGLTHANDQRFVFPTLAQAQAITFDQVRDLIKSTMDKRPVEITLVGDVDPQAAIDAIAATFATLPPLPAAPPVAPGGDHVVFPDHDLDKVLYHKGRADQSISLVAWPIPDELTDTQTSRGLAVLSEILNQRVFATIRQTLGQAYDAHAARDQSWVFKNYGVLSVSGSVATGQDDAFMHAVAAIVGDLKTHPVTQDELDRARGPLIEKWQNNQKDNQHWMYVIPHITDDVTQQASEAKEHDELMNVTPQIIQALATTYFKPEAALHVRVLPETPTQTAASPQTGTAQ